MQYLNAAMQKSFFWPNPTDYSRSIVICCLDNSSHVTNLMNNTTFVSFTNMFWQILHTMFKFTLKMADVSAETCL